MMTCVRVSPLPRQPLLIFVVLVVRECATAYCELIDENFAVAGILRVEEGERVEGDGVECVELQASEDYSTVMDIITMSNDTSVPTFFPKNYKETFQLIFSISPIYVLYPLVALQKRKVTSQFAEYDLSLSLLPLFPALRLVSSKSM
jgi:hypothetical protein